MIVEARVVGRPGEVVDVDSPVPDGPTTLRALLTGLVRGEVAAYEQRRQDRRLLSVLTPADLAVGATTGRYTHGGRTVPAAPSPEVATDRALQAVTDGLVLVVLDGEPLDDLDAQIVLSPTSRLRCVRLVALAGG